jgi:hypothetical protein
MFEQQETHHKTEGTRVHQNGKQLRTCSTSRKKTKH